MPRLRPNSRSARASAAPRSATTAPISLARREEGGGLGGDHLQIGLLAGGRVVRGDELQHLALGDHRGGFREDAQHVERAVLDHELKGAAEEEIADQHRRLVAPDRIGGGKAAAEIGGVDHVVMQQRRRVDELDRGGERQMAAARVAAELRRGEGQHRPEPLAAGRDDMAGHLRNERHRALHPFEDDPVDELQIVGHEGDERAHVGGLRGFGVFQAGHPGQVIAPCALVRRRDGDGHGK